MRLIDAMKVASIENLDQYSELAAGLGRALNCSSRPKAVKPSAFCFLEPLRGRQRNEKA